MVMTGPRPWRDDTSVGACGAPEVVPGALRFYKSTVWEKKRLEILKRDNYECQICKREGGFTPATTVHHIIPLEQRLDLALDDDNLLSVCAACHNREHPEKFIEPNENAKTRIFPERW